MNRPLRFAALFALGASAYLAAQDRPIYRAEANYVEVDAVAVDSRDAFVGGLTADDFEVREDQKLVSVESFTFVELPTKARPSTGAVAPARVNPEIKLEKGALDGRLYLIFLDPQGTGMGSLDVRRRAREFVLTSMQTGDVAAVWNSDVRGRDLTFTSDKPDLLKLIDAKRVTGASANRNQQLELRDAVQLFGSVQGRRKSLLLFTEGWPVIVTGHSDPRTGRTINQVTSWFSGLEPGAHHSPSITDPADQLAGFSQVDITGRADVHIYTIDARGLVAPGNVAPGPFGYRSATAEDTAADVAANLDTLSANAMDLKIIADSTGGLSFINSNDFKKGFERIVEDNSRYYVLGYRSPSKTRDGRFVPISVKSLKPGVTIRARKGYIAR